jgi:hypothetical protein
MRKKKAAMSSTQYCPQCGGVVPLGARYCPSCGTDLLPVGVETAALRPSPRPKSSGVSTRWKIIGGIMIIFFIFAVGSRGGNENRHPANVVRLSATSPARGANSVTSTRVPAAKKSPQPTRTPAPTPTPPPLGTTKQNPAPFSATLTGGGAKVQLLGGHFASEFGYSEPKGGYKYLVMKVRIEGADSESHNYGPSNFSGEDANTGAGYDSAFVFGDDTLGSDTLSRGEFVTGTVALEVQETADAVIVKYDPKMFNEEDLYWLFE